MLICEINIEHFRHQQLTEFTHFHSTNTGACWKQRLKTLNFLGDQSIKSRQDGVWPSFHRNFQCLADSGVIPNIQQTGGRFQVSFHTPARAFGIYKQSSVQDLGLIGETSTLSIWTNQLLAQRANRHKEAKMALLSFTNVSLAFTRQKQQILVANTSR